MWTAASKTSMNLAVKDWKLVSTAGRGSAAIENLETTICQTNGLLPKRRLNSAIEPTEL